MKKVILAVTFFLLCSCSAMTGLATDAVLGSSTKGMDVTAMIQNQLTNSFKTRSSLVRSNTYCTDAPTRFINS